MPTVDVVIYSYKNKKLYEVVRAVRDNYSGISNIFVYDQHPLDRSEVFSDLDNVVYTHIFWDWQISPTRYKLKIINESSSDYLLVLSDDIVLGQGCIDHAIQIDLDSKESCLVSGFGKSAYEIKDIFSFKLLSDFDASQENKIVNPLFVFGKTEVFKKIGYPSSVKYFGESEMLSFMAFKNKVKIYSISGSFVKDLKLRTLETKYKTFSLEHGYNSMLRTLDLEFWNFLGFDSAPLSTLPYNPDDVYYDPNNMEFDNLDSRRFISGVRAIY